jgi:hypothetical protein
VVDRDYATFVSRYDTQAGVITASRHINFLHRQVLGDRTTDYAAFLHAVQTDQGQLFTLTRRESQPSQAAAPGGHAPKTAPKPQPQAKP